MKHLFLFKPLSLLSCILMLLVGSLSWGQALTGDIALKGGAESTPAVFLNGSVRVIDNKGTIKYLQSQNGITMLTNTTADRTTTTWQLGGTLTDNTYIDVDGNVFGFDGIELVNVATLAASTDASTESDHGVGTGWTLLVRDENSGAVKKLLATELIQSGTHVHTATLANETTDPTITVTGISTDAAQVWVYRNGAKLIAGPDYTVGTDAVTLVSTNYPIYENDEFEIPWVK